MTLLSASGQDNLIANRLYDRQKRLFKVIAIAAAVVVVVILALVVISSHKVNWMFLSIGGGAILVAEAFAFFLAPRFTFPPEAFGFEHDGIHFRWKYFVGTRFAIIPWSEAKARAYLGPDHVDLLVSWGTSFPFSVKFAAITTDRENLDRISTILTQLGIRVTDLSQASGSRRGGRS